MRCLCDEREMLEWGPVTDECVCAHCPCSDAEDAVYGRNGYGFGDCKLRVEYPRSSSSKFSSPMGGGPRGRFGPPTRRSEFRVIVTGTSELLLCS